MLFLMAAVACTTGEPRDLPEGPLQGLDSGVEDGGVDDAEPDADDAGTACEAGSTLGQECAGNAQCQDGCFCNGVEICVENVCQAGPAAPCQDDIECTVESCDEDLDICVFDTMDELCSDGDACNGAEVCDRGLGCRPAAPLYCNDESSCTVDSCDPEVGCVFTPRDLDGDGFISGSCGGDDCDDDPRGGAAINPDAPEDCRNRRDDNCDGRRDYADPSCIPTNDDCESAEMIDGEGTYSGSTAGLSSSTSLSCGGSGNDAFFRLTIEETTDVRLALATGSSSAGVSLRSAALCDGGDIACNSGSSPNLLSRSVPPGDYFIIVKQATAGVFDLNVRFEPPTMMPPIDLCGRGTLDVSEGGTFEGFFSELTDDYRLSCNSSARRDAAYTFTITERKDVTISARAMGGSFNTVYLALTSDCDTTDATIQCRSGSSTEISRRGLPPGTYWILVESNTSGSDANSFSMTVDISDAEPRLPGDACETAIDITETGSGMVPLGVSEFDSGVSCSGSTNRDVYYTFELTETRDVTIESSGAGFHFLSLATECGVTGSELRCGSGSGTKTETFRSLAPGRYYVTVMTSLSSGSSMVSVETSEPTPIPPNDRCDGAIEIGADGYISTDTLIDFEDDVRGCSFSGADAFYELTLTERREVLITVQPDGDRTHSHNLTLRSSCASTDNILCRSGRPATISEILDPGTYILIVESTTEADYRIRVVTFPAE